MALPRHTLCFFLACIFTYVTCASTYPSECPRYCNNCDVDPDTCKYGSVTGFCGYRVCAQGPDMVCADKGPRGKCGDGLKCKCGRCAGCSTRTFPLECSAMDLLCLE